MRKPRSQKQHSNSAEHSSELAAHPGSYVRDKALTPRKLSVTAAAKLAGVGRPAFSNFLNGNTSTTPEMAKRVEQAFGIAAELLLQMQAAHDAASGAGQSSGTRAKAYVPPFLSFKAADIETWVTRNIGARARLPVFLRVLANSTLNQASKIDFPGNDDSQRAGWDGYIESDRGNQWVPAGVSGWEFGVDQSIKPKADKDYQKSITATRAADRRDITFVFVTPLHWPGKKAWEEEHRNRGDWKDVRAYDSSDIEQWLEQSIAGQTWLANETKRHSKGVRTLERVWKDWADVASPSLSPTLFVPAVASAERVILSRLKKEPDGSTIVAADSTDEALAFVAQFFFQCTDPSSAAIADRVLVFDEPGTLPQFAQGNTDFVAVASTREVERELASINRKLHSFVLYPRNAANADPHVELEPLNYEAFRSGLEASGHSRDDITKLANESGRSLTVLRRRLANVPAIKTPEWAADSETATDLIPLLFAGAWNARNPADQTVLTLLAGEDVPFQNVERAALRLCGLNDAPLWSAGAVRGIKSKIDLLFAISSTITEGDIRRYFNVARLVLGEDDPKLDLPEEDRWAAAIYGKTRETSSLLREGVAETLVLLAVHGNQLFQHRLGIDCELEAARLVRELLTPLKTRLLEAHDRDLTAYAEAAPDTFLSILENDLSSNDPQTYGLIRPVGTNSFFSGCPRSGLLWALEGLAWNPETLPRAAFVLAQLAQIELSDNWTNKPINSLSSIFRCWMPQTSADLEIRLSLMRQLKAKFPDVMWSICVEQFEPGQKSGHYSHKPSWRNDGHGYGEPFKTWAPIREFQTAMIALAIDWGTRHSAAMLSDLVRNMSALTTKQQNDVWLLIDSWSQTADEAEKAQLREHIRIHVLSKRARRMLKGQDDFARITERGKSAFEKLEPKDTLTRNGWLFREHWVEESADDLNDEDFDYKKREARISELRTSALQEVLGELGYEGIYKLADNGNAAYVIGRMAADCLITDGKLAKFIELGLARVSETPTEKSRFVIMGALQAAKQRNKLVDVLFELKQSIPHNEYKATLLFSPFCKTTWIHIDQLTEHDQEDYWKQVTPEWIHDSDDEMAEAVERLLSKNRARAAFWVARFKLEILAIETLFRLLSEIPKSENDEAGRYKIETYDIEEAFRIINKANHLSLEQKASLEFTYIDLLSSRWSADPAGIPNLERYVESHPEFFVQALVWTYRRSGDGEDPEEYRTNAKDAERLAESGFKLIEAVNRIPGHNDLGELEPQRLLNWVEAVQKSAKKLDRLEVANLSIGKILSHAPARENGLWPCEPVLEVLESLHSEGIIRGVCNGLYNSRGVVTRGEGGDQERELAKQYRRWADAVKLSHRYVYSNLLSAMARTYEEEAKREDLEAGLRRRMR